MRKKRILALLSIGILAILSAIFYGRYFLSRPIGDGPAGPRVDRKDFETIWTTSKVQVIGIGDSITAGLGAKNASHTFFNRLLNNPSDEFSDMKGLCLKNVIPNLEAINFAMSGSTSREHFDVLHKKLTVQAPDVFGLIVMTSGGNDIVHSYGRRPAQECAMYGATLSQAEPWIDSYGERLNAMLSRISECYPGGCEVYLADIYDPTDGLGDAPSVYLPHWPDGLAIHSRYNATIRRTAEKHRNVHVVPLHQTFLGHGAHCQQFWRSTYDSQDPHYWYFDNIEDPNDRGYDAIRRAFINTIAKNTQLRKP